MRIARRTIFSVAVLALCYAVLWCIDPAVWEIHRRFPTAKVTDCYEHPWLVPPFLRRSFPPSTDLYFGDYLSVELADAPEPIDLATFDDLPVFLVELIRCRVSNLHPRGRILIRRSAVLNDCDLSLLPPTQRTELSSLPGVSRYAYGD